MRERARAKCTPRRRRRACWVQLSGPLAMGCRGRSGREAAALVFIPCALLVGRETAGRREGARASRFDYTRSRSSALALLGSRVGAPPANEDAMRTVRVPRLAFWASFALVIAAGGGCPSSSSSSPPENKLPQAATLSAEQLREILPKDADGNAILLEVGGVPLTLGSPRRDAIGAAGKCTDLEGNCLIATKDLDACVEQLPVCRTATPWEEAEACCSQACIDAYREERRLGASQIEAGAAVFGSDHECFPGLQEQYRAAGGTPYLAPRRAR